MISKKMVLSILTIAFISVAAAGTWAEYTVTSAPKVQTATASEFGMDVGEMTIWQMGDAVATTWAPGQTITTTVDVTNTGDIPATLTGTFSAPAATEGAADVALEGVAQVNLVDSLNGQTTGLVDADSAGALNFGVIGAHETDTITISVSIPDSATIDVAGGSIIPTLTLTLTQS